jgi:hypothetical protein
MLIATSRPFGLAYLVPAFQIMADLKTMFPERTAHLPQEEDLRKLETQYSLYEQVAKEDKLHRYQDYTEHIETEQEGRSFPQHLAHELRSGKGKGKVEVYIVRCDRGTRNDSVHFTAESANRRMGDLVRKGDKSAMVTALTLAHGKVDSPEDRILAVLKLASLYRQQGRLEAAERIERQGRILQTHDPHFKSITTARSAVTTFLSSATAQSRRSSHTGSIPGSGPSSATTQTIENQHSSASRVALQAGNGKKGNIKPVVFDPEATRQQPSMSTKKEDHQIGDGKRANAAPDVPGREAIKHHMSAGRERTRVQAPALGFSNVYDWLLKLVW